MVDAGSAIPLICKPFAAGGQTGQLTPWNFPSVFGSGTFGDNWMVFVVVTLLASSGFLVLSYMVSQLLRNAKLEAYSKFELFQLVGTWVIALLIAGHVWGMCTFDASVFDKSRYLSGNYCTIDVGGHTVVPPYCVATDFLSQLRARGQDIFQFLITLNYIFSQMFKMVWESRPMGIGYTVEPLGGFQQIQNLFLVGISGFVVSILTVIIQQRILDYFLIAMPFFFMPIGIVLRSFTPTREFGGAVIAMVYASLFIYPMALMMNDVIIFSKMQDIRTGVMTDSYFDQATADANPSNWAGSSGQGGNMYNPRAAGNYVNDSLMRDVREAGSNPALPMSQNDKDTAFFLLSPWPMVMIYFLAAIMLPILNFIVYVEVARELSKLLGAEVDLTNLTRMI